jgi:hypothetical protein
MTVTPAAELQELKQTVEILIQGLDQMVTTQGTHTEMLRVILEAIDEDSSDESPLPGLLEGIVTRLDEQTEILRRMEASRVVRTPVTAAPGL